MSLGAESQQKLRSSGNAEKNFSEFFDEELGDDDVFVLESIAEARQRKDDKLRVTLVFTLKDTMTSLPRIIKIIEVKYLVWLQAIFKAHSEYRNSAATSN